MKHPPGPRTRETPALLSALRNHPLDLMVDLQNRFGDFVHFRLGFRHAYLVNHPETTHWILRDGADRYAKSQSYERLKPLLGLGLLTHEGDEWRKNRRLIAPIFHPKNLQSLFPTMQAALDDLRTRWQTKVDENAPSISLHEEMTHLTLDLVCRCLFSIRLSDDTRELTRALHVTLDHANRRALSFLPPPQWMPIASNLRSARALEILDRLVYRIIEERQKEAAPHADLLQMLLDAQKGVHGFTFTAKQIRDEVMTFLLAGHETSANALSWIFVLLHQHPKVAHRLREEITEHFQARPVDQVTLEKCTYLDAVIHEGLRLYPPAYVIERRAIQEDEIQGYRIAPQSMMILSPYLTQRDARFFPDPSSFQPERFLTPLKPERNRLIYFPFGAGPRACVGQAFAFLEMKLALAAILQQFEIQCSANELPGAEAKITLRPLGGLPATIRRFSA